MRLIFLAVAMLPSLSWAGTLSFAEKVREVKLAADATTATVEFPFTNRSAETVTIKRYESNCSCLAVGPKGGKLEYAPGESGVITSEFDVGSVSGQVEKLIAVWLDGDKEESPSVNLTVKLNVPEVIAITPKTVKWGIGKEATPQSIVFTVDWPEPVAITEVSTTSDHFTHQLKTLEEGKKYELVLTPINTEKSKMGVFRIKTDCSLAKHQEKVVYALIRKETSHP